MEVDFPISIFYFWFAEDAALGTGLHAP